MFGFLRCGNVGNTLTKQFSINVVFTMGEKLIDDFLLQKPSVQSTLLFCHASTSLVHLFNRG